MKKTIKIVLITVLIAIVCFVVFNWNNIIILKDAFTNKYTEEDIKKFEKESYGILKDAAEKTLETEINELSDDVKTALEKGEITEEDAKKIILGEKEFVNGKVVNKDTLPEGYVDKSAEIISKIYVLEATYKGKLDAIEHNMLVAYNQLPEKEKTTMNKYKLANNAIAQGNALKVECDAKMNQLLSELEANLKEGKKDTSIVKQIRSFYENEKNTVQAYYLSKYSNR